MAGAILQILSSFAAGKGGPWAVGKSLNFVIYGEALICANDQMCLNKSWLDLVPNIKLLFAVITNHMLCVLDHLGNIS